MLFITHMKWKDKVVIGLKCEEQIWLETIKVRWEEKIDHNKRHGHKKAEHIKQHLHLKARP